MGVVEIAIWGSSILTVQYQDMRSFFRGHNDKVVKYFYGLVTH